MSEQKGSSPEISETSGSEGSSPETNGGVRTNIDDSWEWLLLDGNRMAVTAIVLGIIFGTLIVVELAGWVPMNRIQPVYYVFSALLGGNITLITVVVSINQLLLSQELKSPGELESQMEGVIEYRKDVEDAAGEIAPVKPMGFLRLLVENTRQEAQRIGGLAVGMTDEDVQKRVSDFVSTLTDRLDAVDELLQESDAGTFEVLSVTLSTNYAEQINEARRIRAVHGDDLSEESMDAFDGLIDNLQNVDIARQYFKSVYLQDELSSLSRALMYAGIPAEALSAVALLALTAGGGGGTFPMENARLLVPVAATVGFLPLALLIAFILRTATVTQRTAATLPFTTPEQER